MYTTMKKSLILTAVLLMASTTLLYAQSKQTYSSLWKQASDAENKDLPRTQVTILKKIAKKAEKEKNYGQLLKAELSEAKAMTIISPDSLKPAIERLEVREQKAEGNWALQSVYDAVLVTLYETNTQLFDDARQQADVYRKKALSHAEVLAATKVADYTPFAIKEKDSHFFGDDLLSVVGYETGQFKELHCYYLTTNNREAQLLTAIEDATIEQLDSLIDIYGDLEACGEAAIKREQQMYNKDNAERIAFIDNALQRWGNWKRMNILRNTRLTLTTKQFNAVINHRVTVPNREEKVALNDLRGIDKITMRVYKVNADGDINLNPNNTKDFARLKSLLSTTSLQEIHHCNNKNEYEFQEDSMMIPGLPVGVYMIEFETSPKTEVSRNLYFVTNVHLLAQELPNKQIRYVTVNSTTGQPIAGASIRIKPLGSSQSENTVTTLTTNSQGEYIYTYKGGRQRTEVFATTKDDRACPPSTSSLWFNYRENTSERDYITIMTDRAIYRPGQKVHMAAIVYHAKEGISERVIEGKQVTATLYDANGKVVEEKQLTTDAFGTVSADFMLPAKGLNGNYHFRVDRTNRYFRVEEYKRPTFQVEFPKVEQDYKAGDTITVIGTAKSYAGVPVQEGKVSYRVERRRAWWWFSYMSYYDTMWIGNDVEDENIFTGETTTDANGHFEVKMPLTMPATQHPLFCNFVVTADVTDQAGESHYGELSVPLGNRKTALSIEVENKMLAEKMVMPTLHLKNAAGNDMKAKVRYQLDGGKWNTIETNTPITLPRLKSGKHTLKADYEGETIEKSFIIFSLNDKKPAEETNNWFYTSGNFTNDGTPVTVQVGSSDKDVHIVYTIVSGNTIIEKGAVDKSNELINRKFKYKPEYGNGLALSYAWVKDGEVYTHSFTIQRPLEDKQLHMKWETFRNKLVPGQQEEWTLTIEPTTTEGIQLMATLFDKSLDQIRKHDWSYFSPHLSPSLPSLSWNFSYNTSCYFHGQANPDYLKTQELLFSHFDKDCYPEMWTVRSTRPFKRGGLLREVELSASNVAIGTYDVVKEESVTTGYAKPLSGKIAGLDIKQKTTEGTESDSSSSQVSMRENLQETAFFYPQLMADSTGRVSMKFTLPESLTTWRFIGLAHTKNLKYGFLEGEAVAKKDVMIQPNLPRFIRMGDEATITARVFNTSDKEVEGTARLELIDPETDEIVYSENKNTKVAPNATFSVAFQYVCRRETNGLLVAKVSFAGEGFSDGEQHYLPILPNKEQVTVTIPFTQTAPGTKTIDLAAMVPADASQARITIEYTNNPAWFMIQALPTLAHPFDNCVICQTASLYTNTLGRYIMNLNPQAKHIFEAWKQENGTETSLMSALEKNESLKDLVLNETPWVADANRESEQKRQLSDFFDSSLIDQRITSALEQLNSLQHNDGSWGWWPGMEGSFFMTVEVSEMLVRLNHMAGEQADTKKMLAASFAFMDQEILKLVAEMKKEEKKGHRQSFPSYKALQYLYMSKLSGRALSSKVSEAQTYLKKLLKKDVKNQSIYEKALSAIILDAPSYIKSLKEYTVYKENMGRYFDTPRAGYSWRDYRIPTQVAAIEALQRLSPTDTTTIEEMRRWLLQEKRAQAWDTPINSVNAIYAFLNQQNTLNIQNNQQQHTSLKIDGESLETPKATAGIGYVKTTKSYHGENTFTAEKVSTGTSWGSVYAQFLQPTASIKANGSEISVKREILPAEANASLKVGDRVKVRITIQAERDLDFVEVIDKRAACMEPINQLSGYHYGYYCSPKDNATNYYFDRLPKGKRVIETEYYIDRIGTYETGTLTAGCAYAPEFRCQTTSETIIVK